MYIVGPIYVTVLYSSIYVLYNQDLEIKHFVTFLK